MTLKRAEPALRASDLVKRFGGVAAVDGVSIDVAPGQIVGLIGPNGAGKTTFFDLIAGEQRPTSGGIALVRSEAASSCSVSGCPGSKRP